MAYWQNAMDRILNHGGAFIVFADARLDQQFYFVHKHEHKGHAADVIPFDNWSFLTLFNKENFDVTRDHGAEVKIPESIGEDERWIALVKNSTFTCTLDWRNWIMKQTCIPIATNKYESPVGSFVVPSKPRNGLALVLPQVHDKVAIVFELITGLLPETLPALFPHTEGARWTKRPEYELGRVVELQSEILQVEVEAKAKTETLKQNVELARREFGFLHQLLTTQDRELVGAVQKTLELLGFVNVVDVDVEREAEGVVERDEDLQIRDKSPLILVEVKGVSGIPSDDDSLQVAKHLAPRMKQLNRKDIQGLTIINHQRHLPALDRENRTPFRDVILQAAKKLDVGLMTTWDLHRLARGFIRNDWKHEEIAALFYQRGRIEPIPSSYSVVGVIDEYWEKASAFSLTVKGNPLSLGDKLAFELPVEFVEHTIKSIQVDRENIHRAEVGQTVAIQTILTKVEAKPGTRVFKVTRA